MLKNLWASRKFRIMIFDAGLALIALTVSTFLPEDYGQVIMQYVAILQAPVFAVVVGIALEDAGEKAAGNATPDR